MPPSRLAAVRTNERVVAAVAVLLLTAGAIVLGNLVLVVAGVVAGFAGVELTPLRTVLLSLAALQGVGFVGGGLAYLYWRGGPSVPIAFPSLNQWGLVLVGWVAMLAANLVTGLLTQLANIPTPESTVTDLALGNPTVILVLFVASFLIIGPGEDFFFRGVVQGRLREVFGPKAAIGLATVMFGLIHVTNFLGSPPISIAATIGRLTVVSVVLGGLYEYTDNLTVPVAIHAVYNATLFGLLYLATVYDIEPAVVLL
ncbi:MAG: CPBP family intramembrane glutamic endopeptidase [Halobacteriales archaeon]|nr:CPBP family intramembrane glutamic endopeptidase [Halobacteriales archaeon]